MMRLIFISLILLNIYKLAFAVSSKEILHEIYKAMYSKDTTYISKMKIYRTDKVYEKLIKVYIKGSDKALIEILEPKRDRGIKILRIKDDSWIYLPSVSKTIRLVGRMNFMGSDFIYDDILKVNLEKDYEVKLMEEQEEDILLIVKAKSNKLSYGIIKYEIIKENYLPKKAEFFGVEGEKLIKTLDFKEIKKFNDKLHPSLLIMQIAFSKDYKTTLEIISFSKEPIPLRIFTKEYMEKEL